MKKKSLKTRSQETRQNESLSISVRDLAADYGVSSRAIYRDRATKRHISRFPDRMKSLLASGELQVSGKAALRFDRLTHRQKQEVVNYIEENASVEGAMKLGVVLSILSKERVVSSWNKSVAKDSRSEGSGETGVSKLSVDRVFITPEMAMSWLKDFNINNYREPSLSVVRKYARDMLNGRWTENSATISFCQDGSLSDGQQRLMAIEMAGAGQWMNVLRGLPNSARLDRNQDQPRNRNVAQIMAHEGVRHAPLAAGAVRVLYRLGSGRSLMGGVGSAMLSSSTIVAVVECMDKDFFDVLDEVVAFPVKKVIPPSLLAAFYWLATKDSQESARHFFRVLGKHEPALSDHPANSLRDQLLTLRASSSGKIKSLGTDYICNLLFVSYKSHVAGKPLKVVKAHQDIPLTKPMLAALQRIVDVASCDVL